WTGKHARNKTVKFHGNINHGTHYSVDSDENVPNGHGPRNSDDMVLGPVVRDEASLAKNGRKDGGVERGSPHPVTSDFTITLDEVTIPEKLAANVEND